MTDDRPQRRRRRDEGPSWTLSILLSLVCGIVATVGVSYWCAFVRDAGGAWSNTPVPDGTRWPISVPDSWPPPAWEGRYARIGMRVVARSTTFKLEDGAWASVPTDPIGAYGLSTHRTHRIVVASFGLPFPAMSRIAGGWHAIKSIMDPVHNAPFLQRDGSESIEDGPLSWTLAHAGASTGRQSTVFPGHIEPAGFIANTVFYAAIVLAMRKSAAVYRLLRRIARRRRGDCPWCGYALRGAARCPECGAT